MRWRALTLAMARVVVLACRQRALACALQPRAVAARRCEVLLLRVHSGEGQLTSCRDASCRLALCEFVLRDTRAWEGLSERTLGIAFSGGGGPNRVNVGQGEAGWKCGRRRRGGTAGREAWAGDSRILV